MEISDAQQERFLKAYDVTKLLLEDFKIFPRTEQEEQQVFPAVRKAFDDDRVTRLGGALRVAKAVAPTRAHPAAPKTPPGNLVAVVVAGVVDRARDVAQAAVDRVRNH